MTRDSFDSFQDLHLAHEVARVLHTHPKGLFACQIRYHHRKDVVRVLVAELAQKPPR